MENRKVMLYISMSVDGFIATKDDDLSWLSVVQDSGEDYGYHELEKQIDTYIVGRRTYDVIKKLTGRTLPQAEKFECYVITRQPGLADPNVNFYNGEIEYLIKELKSKPGKHIYCDGGGQIVQLLMQKNLIDEYIISVIPIMLGSGKRLFIGGVPPVHLKPLPSKYYKSGLVQLHYQKV